MRYAIPQPDSRVMSGGRHKKVSVFESIATGLRGLVFRIADKCGGIGDQASDQDRMFDVQEEKNQGQSRDIIHARSSEST